MSKGVKILLIVVICFFVIAGAIVGGAFLIVNQAKDVEEYKIGENVIPAIKLIVGERKVSGVSSTIENGVSTKTYTYINIESVKEDLIKYVSELRTNQNYKVIKSFDLNDATGDLQLAKKAYESDKIIVISIEWSANTYTVSLNLLEGTLTDL